MYIDQSFFVIIDLAIILIAIFTIISGFKQGFVLQLVSLLGLYIAIFLGIHLAPIMADIFKIFQFDENSNIVNALFSRIMNIFVWFLIIIIVVMIIIAVVKPILKFVTKLPIVHSVNTILGGGLSIIYCMVGILLMYSIFNSPLIANGREVIDHTLLKPLNEVSNYTSNIIYDNLFKNEDIQAMLNQINLDDVQLHDNIINWLKEYQIGE